MPTVVVPFRGTDPKRRLSALTESDRLRLAEAMLADVLAAAVVVGEVFVVAPEPPLLPAGAQHVVDPHRGLGAAVRAGLDAAAAVGAAGPYLVVNADVPCAEPRDLLALAGAVPADGLALVVARRRDDERTRLRRRASLRARLRSGQRRAVRGAGSVATRRRAESRWMTWTRSTICRGSRYASAP